MQVTFTAGPRAPRRIKLPTDIKNTTKTNLTPKTGDAVDKWEVYAELLKDTVPKGKHVSASSYSNEERIGF